MRFEEKLQKLRKEKGLSQEALAEMLDVSRQAISKWEGGFSYPEMEKLIALTEIFGVTLDSLVKDGTLEDDRGNVAHAPFWTTRGSFFEYKSERKMFGLPLVHINIGWGAKKAKGVLAIGNIATGILSIGLLSKGILAIGLLSLGVIGIGALSIALLLSIGSIAIGTFAIGALAIGVFALGALAIGMFTTGALSLGTHIAIGYNAHGHIAIGRIVSGVREFVDTSPGNLNLSAISGSEVREAIYEEFPGMWRWITNLMTSFLGR